MSRPASIASAEPVPEDVPAKDDAVVPTEPAAEPAPPTDARVSTDRRPSSSHYSSDEKQETAVDDKPVAPPSDTSAEPPAKLEGLKPPENKARRFSWRSFSFMKGGTLEEEHNSALAVEVEHKKKLQVREDKKKRAVKASTAEKKAKDSAMIVRSMIIGPSGITLPAKKSRPFVKSKAERVKSELTQPQKAKKVIAHLRMLSPSNDLFVAQAVNEDMVSVSMKPIHAVCLPYTDEEADELHFAKLYAHVAEATEQAAGLYNASINQITELFADMSLVDLVAAPNLGFGGPADGPGLFSGAVPSSQSLIEGIQELTPQIMALGYATGKVLLPDHSSIYPPKDRMSVLTYWWGYEVVLPKPSLEYLARVPSIMHSVLNFLTALSVLNGGVREVLPFIRYIATFVDAQWNLIRQADEGEGVVCAATWLIPAALAPRPWDFPEPPAEEVKPISETDPVPSDEPNDIPDSPASSLPPTRPSSPPTLLPPLALSQTTFDAPAPGPATDDAPVELNGTAQVENIPAVTIEPPTPPASAFLDVPRKTVEATA